MPESGHVLVVCTANICRSPMAAALLQHALRAQPEPLRSLRVVSAGVTARAGQPMTDHSVAALRKVGINAAGHVSQPLTQQLLDGALAVLCMTEAHRKAIQLSADPVPEHLLLFREFLKEGEREIADPYGCPFPLYEASRDEMVEAVPSIVDYLRGRLARR